MPINIILNLVHLKSEIELGAYQASIRAFANGTQIVPVDND